MGRFTQGDPFPGVLALPLTLNPYVYGLNSPTNLTDPTGKDLLFLGHFQGPSESPAFGRVRSFATGFAGEKELAKKWAANFLRAMVDQGWKSATQETIRSSAWSFVNNLASFVAPYLIH